MPERFELGTLPYELLAGTTAAVDFLAGLGAGGRHPARAAARGDGPLEAYEDGLREHLEAGLAELPGVHLWSRAAHRTPTLLLTFDGHAAADAFRFLAERGVNAPAGHFYAIEASRWLGPRRHRRPAGRAGALHRRATTSTACSAACGSSSPSAEPWRSHVVAGHHAPPGGSGRRTTGRTLRAEGSRS